MGSEASQCKRNFACRAEAVWYDPGLVNGHVAMAAPLDHDIRDHPRRHCAASTIKVHCEP